MTAMLPALAGGALIGLGAVVLMALAGRIAGISGILSVALPGPGRASSGDRAWRWAFLAGLVAAPPVLGLLAGGGPSGAPWLAPPLLPVPWMAVAGLLVGVGTGLGSGCTSGHGVCGLARRSPRSLVATLVFMACAMATVFVVRHGVGR